MTAFTLRVQRVKVSIIPRPRRSSANQSRSLIVDIRFSERMQRVQVRWADSDNRGLVSRTRQRGSEEDIGDSVAGNIGKG
jgi:hypothetical protein